MKTRYPLGVQRSEGRSRQLSAERLVNMYAEQAPSNGRSPVSARSVAGLQLLATQEGTVRGFYSQYSRDTLFAVIGQTLFEIDQNFTFTDRGTVGGFGRVGIVDNGTQLTITTGRLAYVYTAIDGLEVVPTENFNGASQVEFMNGFFVYNNIDQALRNQFFISGLYDGLSHDPLDFATAERYPDRLIRPFADHSQLMLFGERSIEPWFAVPETFPFAPAQGSAIDQGLGAEFSIERVDETIFWLDDEGIVRRLNGLTPQRVSTHAIEYQISRGDWANAFSWSYVEEGHHFYLLTIPATTIDQEASTLVYDASTGLWHERRSYEMDFLDVSFYARAYDRHLCFDSSGNLFDLSLDHVDYAGEPIVTEMQFPPINLNGSRFIVHSFQLDADVGRLGETTTLTRVETEVEVEEVELVVDFTEGGVADTEFGAIALGFGAGNGRFMIGMNSSLVSVSDDGGATWTQHETEVGGTTNVRSVEYVSGDTWIASGGGGDVLQSLDNGENWVVLDAGTNAELHFLMRNPTTGRVVVGGEDGRYFYSDSFPVMMEASGTHDGADNTFTLSDATQNFTPGELVGGLVVNVTTGQSQNITTNTATTLSAAPIRWDFGDEYKIYPNPNFQATPQSPFFALGTEARAATFDNDLFIVVGEQGGIETSTDGITWTQRDAGFGAVTLLDVIFADGLFYVVSQDGQIATSPDGIAWTLLSGLPFAGVSVNGIAFGNGIFIVGLANDRVAYSEDGLTWELADEVVDTASSFVVDFLAFEDNDFVLLADSGFNSPLRTFGFTAPAIEPPPPPDVSFTSDTSVTLENNAVLSVSADGGNTYGFTQPVQSLGRRGEFTTRVKWNRLGQYDNSFTPRIIASAAVQKNYMTAYIELERCDIEDQEGQNVPQGVQQ